MEAANTRQTPVARTAVLLFVVLVHGEFVYLLSHGPSWNRRSSGPGEPSLDIVLLERVTPEPIRKAGMPPPRARTAGPPASPTRTAVGTPPADTSSNAITVPSTTPDWYGDAEQVAKEATSRPGPRAFEHVMPVKPKAADGIFAPAPEHRAGTWADPDTYYATDECHFEFDRSARPPPTAVDRGLQTLRCKRAAQGGGGDLFKDLKPGYLDQNHTPQTP